MIDLESTHLEIVLKILGKHVPECTVWAFGSRVKGDAESYSDLDLAIISDEKLDRKLIYRLEEAFEESELPFRVDVLDWNAISEGFREVISTQYSVIQSRGHMSD